MSGPGLGILGKSSDPLGFGSLTQSKNKTTFPIVSAVPSVCLGGLMCENSASEGGRGQQCVRSERQVQAQPSTVKTVGSSLWNTLSW